MKRLYALALLGACAIGNISAQYRIDLSKVTYPSIEYLELGNPGPKGKEIRVNNLYMTEAGVPQLPVMGEIHYSRMDARYWKDALLKMKASGINIVATYCIWNLHEEFEGQLSWEGNLNLRRFVQLCGELGLKVHLRIGPYCNAEIRNGGLPDWIVKNRNLDPRSNDPLYMAYSRRWYEAVYNQVKGLFHKDGGPVMAVQLENEYVRKGMIIPHLTALKKMAVEIGFDVPVYSMTHWMDSEYPKGEIVPYAGFYIEAPWTASGKNEIPTGNFEFFTYNRLSDNIGTDIIKLDGEVESLSGENNDSPFFTCEIGVGTTAFYHRRAVVPEEMAGEMINLRLGCGANLMGYYMYAGGTNPVGEATTMQSSGPRVSYDYQAPVREYGTLGTVMQEVKKYNYFMNDFGQELAPAVAYLPTSNQDRDNLQWAVRTDGEKGYLFCSNYLYKHERQDFRNVRFSVKLKDETITMPEKKVTVKGGTYFFWPFNLRLDGGITLKYATVQPVCMLEENGLTTYFFFEDDGIPAEYLLDRDGVRDVRVTGGVCRKGKKGWFVNGLKAGKSCMMDIVGKAGKSVRIITLTEEESDMLWKEERNGRKFVAFTASSLISDGGKVTLIDDSSEASIDLYEDGTFRRQVFHGAERHLKAETRSVAPMADSRWIAPSEGDTVSRQYVLRTLSDIDRAYLRYASDKKAVARVNGQTIEACEVGGYCLADVSGMLVSSDNVLEFSVPEDGAVIAEVEVLLKNGERVVWNTDATWLSSRDNRAVRVTESRGSFRNYAPEEHLAVYEVKVPDTCGGEEETRMYISYKGDVANLYQGGELMADSYYDGTEWIVSLDRLKDSADVNPLVIRIDGLESENAPIYFEKNVNPAECVHPGLDRVEVKREYRYPVK